MESVLDLNTTLSFVIRILVASLIGAAIGFERKYRAKGAGIGTHVLVAIGAALFMIVSQNGFLGSPRFDAARVAAGVVTGIGFLGGGIILKQQNRVSGLTTAAGLWVTAAMGLTIGCGMYILGVCCALIVLAWIDIVNRLSHKIGKRQVMVTLSSEDHAALLKAIESLGKNVENYNLTKNDTCYDVEALLSVSQKYYTNDLIPALNALEGVRLDKLE